ncbi:MAG: hypothetical protein VB047_09340 [Anaerotignum propionicum]|uniref:hypothetical protein n=1 Tax=Anaerotignum propionicum TaxID=28446 RepID=UPI002B1F2405|nr:hypothetical protein [Anaerotignum propionicum]MEA5057743.1 hypothetical protein [Anaerotignum propionicum]
MDDNKLEINCDKCFCKRCFENEDGSCMNCERCKENGGANKVWCLIDCVFVGRKE